MKVICKDKRSSSLQTEVIEGGKRQSELVKEVFVHRPTLLGSVSSPGSSHKADVDSLLAAAQTERVQKLLCMPVRDLLAQISTRSQMRDRCSRQPVDTE